MELQFSFIMFSRMLDFSGEDLLVLALSLKFFICTVLLVSVTLECTDICINKTSNCTFVPHKNGVIRLKRLNTLELCDEDKGQVTRGREAGIIIARETDAQTGGLKRSEAC